jgi:hypothetical protein
VFGADEAFRRSTREAIHASSHERWSNYYTPELAALVHRSYRSDFERFEYPQSVDWQATYADSRIGE